MPRIWFTADLHIGHQKLIDKRYRPYASLDAMHADIVRRVNERVEPGDLLYVLGDTFLCNPSKYADVVRSMNGYKVCVRGNHCPSPSKLLAAGFHRVCEEDYLVHYDFFMGPLTFWLAHIPFDNSQDKKRDEVLTRPKAAIPYDVPLCGHVHDAFRISPFGDVNVGLDAWGMNPVSAQEVAKVWYFAEQAKTDAQKLEWRRPLPMPELTGLDVVRADLAPMSTEVAKLERTFPDTLTLEG